MADQELNQEEEGQEVDEQLEQEARSLGWVPEDQFKGDKTKWVDAEEFVERGKHLMPILRQNNARLQKELLTRDQKIGTLETRLENATKAIEKLDKHYSEANKRAVETARKQLAEELKDAREDGDIEREFAIQDKLQDLRQVQDTSDESTPDKNKPPKKPEETASQDLQEFKAENDWFGEDKVKTKAYLRLAEDMREEGNPLTGKAFMDAVVQELESRESGNPRTSKVESSGPSGRRTGTKGFASLPEDAKKACLADAEDLVGPGKRYKDLDAWQKAYAKIYYSE